MNSYVQKQLEAITALTPETIIGLEGISFEAKALAMEGVVEAMKSIEDVDREGDDDPLDVADACRLKFDTEERMIVTEKYVVAGGLCYDSDVRSPSEEMDGEGRILNSGRRGNDESEIRDALGLNIYGSPDFNLEAVSEELAARTVATIRKNRSLMVTLSNLIKGRRIGYVSRDDSGSWDRVCDLVTEAIHREGAETALDYIAEYFLEVSWWNDVSHDWREKLEALADCFAEARVEEAYEAAVEKGKVGNPFAVLLDIYEHSGISYSISGEGMQCRWDTSRGAAVWVPDSCAEDNIRYNVIKSLGVGELRHFGAVGSKDDPCHARYSLDGETWIGEGKGWSWRQAMAELVKATGTDESKLVAEMRAAAKAYARGCIETYNQFLNGDVYGVCFYVIDRETGECVEDDECWGFYGHEYAKGELESGMLSAALRRLKPTH